MPPDDRRTRGLLARSSGACSPDRFHSSHDPVLGGGRKGADLHNTARGCWTARCPIERRVKRGKFHNYESPQLLLGIREGAILYAPLPFLQSHWGSTIRRFKRLAGEVGAGFDESLMIRTPRTGVGIGSIAFPRRKSFRCFVNK